MSAQHEQNLLSSVQTVLVALIENTAISLLCSARKQSAFFFFFPQGEKVFDRNFADAI